MKLQGQCLNCGAEFKYWPSQEKKFCTHRCGMLKYWASRSTIRGVESLWNSWRAMCGRCNNPNASDYKWYGAKGVTVCTEWRGTFKNFKRWALASGYAVGLTLDRIDVRRGYAPKNCRWVPQAEQKRNTTTNVFTHQDILRIQKLKAEGVTALRVAQEYGVTRTQIYNIWNNRCWKNLDPLYFLDEPAPT